MRLTKNRPIVLAVVFGLTALVTMFGLWSAAPVSAESEVIAIEVLHIDDDGIRRPVLDGSGNVIGHLSDSQGVVRCEKEGHTCVGNTGFGYGVDGVAININLYFEALGSSTEEAAITTGRYVMTTNKTGHGSEQTSGPFLASFMDNEDDTLEVTLVMQEFGTITIPGLPGRSLTDSQGGVDDWESQGGA